MERQQLLKNDSMFAGFKIVGKLSQYHDGEREVYHALNPETGETVALTVFNLGCKRYATDVPPRKRIPDFIEEVKFLNSCSNESNVFARVLGYGIAGKKPKRLAWMTQEWMDGSSLTSELARQSVLSKEDTLKIMKTLISGVAEIRSFTRGGGHYGISAENILLEYDGDDLKAVRLIGLSNIGATFHGAVPFDRTEMDKRFLPSETMNGVFSHLTDVYALGMLMGWMLGGLPKYPHGFDEEAVNFDSHSSVELFNRSGRAIDSSNFRSWFAAEVAEKQFSGALRLIWLKATNPIPSNRFQIVENFRQFLDLVGKDKGGVTGRSSTERKTYGSFIPRSGGFRPFLQPPEEEDIDGDSQPQKRNKPETERVREAMDRRGLDAVAGMDNLKQVFRRNFVHIVKNPKIAKAYGITPGNCTLLYGPQGCGKTFIAQKVAEEAGLKYQIVNPSDLGSIYIHGAQEKIAETFREAEKNAPMILIFDEFDAVAPKRDGENHQANEVNELLVQLNDCASKGIYVLATTNRPELIDSAILRTGRVDQMFYVPLPDFKARHDIFALELENRPVSDDIDLDALAKATENFTCSDLSFIVKECARTCFDKTISLGLSEPLPLSQSCILKVISDTRSSVSAAERRKYEELKVRMEQKGAEGERKKVGFAVFQGYKSGKS